MSNEAILVALIALLGVVLTAFVTWLIAERRILTEHVTAERAKWRDRIREKALEVHDAILLGTHGTRSTLDRLRLEFGALLNPGDPEDHGILDCIGPCGPQDCRIGRAEEFGRPIAFLLKHDWERAKLEAGFPLCRWVLRAKRIRYRSVDKCTDCERSHMSANVHRLKLILRVRPSPGVQPSLRAPPSLRVRPTPAGSKRNCRNGLVKGRAGALRTRSGVGALSFCSSFSFFWPSGYSSGGSARREPHRLVVQPIPRPQ